MGTLRYRIFWPLVPAIAMVMIDFTIVSISATTIQKDLGLSETGVQWLVTGFALSTAAFVALGGRLGDILGHRRIVTVGIVLFAASSLICGLVPHDGYAETWLIVFRVLQGLGGALLIPSATVLVLNAFPTEERGKGVATFFIIAGLFTAVGPIAGSYLTEFWTWRAIFWINVPVALLALTELYFVKFANETHPAKIDWAGTFLLVLGMGLTVLGIQQSTVWGWTDPATIGSIAGGVVLLVAFLRVERRVENPLIDVKQLFASRAFAWDNVMTFLVFGPWLGVFFFGSVYFQVVAKQPPTEAGFSILTMFIGFFAAARIGGGWYDKVGPKRPVSLGFLLGAVGLIVWAREMDLIAQMGNNTTVGMILTGAGFGFVLSPLGTDALNRLPDAMRGEASGVNQTFRNFGSAIGVAVMGTIIASATDLTGAAGTQSFADAMELAYYVAAGFMVAGLIATRFMPEGKQEGMT
jgi:EmrB/QacA subfamily drug resistance transporter